MQLAVAGILLQTLFFKFTGAEESVYIFSTLGPVSRSSPVSSPGDGLARAWIELIASLY